MSLKDQLVQPALDQLAKAVAGVKFTTVLDNIKKKISPKISNDAKDQIKELMRTGHYVFLTSDKNSLSSFLVSLMTFIKIGKWPSYTHAFLNVDVWGNENELDFVEGVYPKVKHSKFDEVFDCSNVCVLKATNLDSTEWERVTKEAMSHVGRSYDSAFDIKDATRLSCVETVYLALASVPDAHQQFPDFLKRVQEVGNIAPQMYRDSPDFEVMLEFKSK